MDVDDNNNDDDDTLASFDIPVDTKCLTSIDAGIHCVCLYIDVPHFGYHRFDRDCQHTRQLADPEPIVALDLIADC